MTEEKNMAYAHLPPCSKSHWTQWLLLLSQGLGCLAAIHDSYAYFLSVHYPAGLQTNFWWFPPFNEIRLTVIHHELALGVSEENTFQFIFPHPPSKHFIFTFVVSTYPNIVARWAALSLMLFLWNSLFATDWALFCSNREKKGDRIKKNFSSQEKVETASFRNNSILQKSFS